MERIRERLAYLRGLSEGLNVGQNSPEGRILHGLLEILDEMVAAMERLDHAQEDLEEYVAAVDEDLSDLEDDFYDEYDEEDEWTAEDIDEDDMDAVHALDCTEMVCPNCKETVYVDKDVFTDEDVVEVLCPECHETILVNDSSPAVVGED
jgi:DNA-directed RNA polymerase subunit delta